MFDACPRGQTCISEQNSGLGLTLMNVIVLISDNSPTLLSFVLVVVVRDRNSSSPELPPPDNEPYTRASIRVRSVVPRGWDCQFRTAVECTGAVEKGSGEVEGETDCISNLLHSLGG